MYKSFLIVLGMTSPIFAMILNPQEKMEEQILIHRCFRYETHLYTEALVKDLTYYFKYPVAIETIRLSFIHRILQHIEQGCHPQPTQKVFEILNTDHDNHTQALFERLENHYITQKNVNADHIVSLIAGYFTSRFNILRSQQELKTDNLLLHEKALSLLNKN